MLKKNRETIFFTADNENGGKKNHFVIGIDLETEISTLEKRKIRKV